MIYLLQGNCIVFTSHHGKLSCVELSSETDTAFMTGFFVKKDRYQNLLSEISKVLRETNDGLVKPMLVLGACYFDLPGFVGFLSETLGEQVLITTLLSYNINRENFTPGKYTVIEIEENQLNIFEILVENGTYTILAKDRVGDTQLSQVLANKFHTCLKGEFTLGTLLDFSQILQTNIFIEANIPQGEYGMWMLEGKIGSMLGIDVETFFKILSEAIIEFVDNVFPGGNIVYINTSFGSYVGLKDIVNAGRIRMPDSCQLLNSMVDLRIKKSDDKPAMYKLASYPEIDEPQSIYNSWILAEADSLSISFIYNNPPERYEIDMSVLSGDLAVSTFFSHGRRLVKYLVDYFEDEYNNTHLKIRTIDKAEFYHIINY